MGFRYYFRIIIKNLFLVDWSINWQATLEYKDTIRFTSEWYYDFYKTSTDMYKKTKKQIEEYLSLAEKRELLWTK